MNTEETFKEIERDEIDLLDLIGVLFKHKLLIILITSIAIICVVTYSIISIKLPPNKSPLPNYFKPISTVKINSSNSSSGLSGMIDSSGMGALAGLIGISGAGGASDSAFAIKLAKSNMIADQIAEEFNLREIYGLKGSEYPITNTRKAVNGRLSISEDGSTSTLSISYEDINRELATKIVNRVVVILVI